MALRHSLFEVDIGPVRRSEPRIDSSCCFSTAQESDSRSNVSLATQFFSSLLDRLARSTRDLLNVLATVGEREAGFRSLKDTWADTTTPHGRLMLTVLGGLAEFERELI